ncbi:Sodium-dependent dicarboxylate transporter SdcS [Diplonema papillatum]|nr:Sodium-dependent dicarboxylate transporter SdcS [Diplonema papillatum]
MSDVCAHDDDNMQAMVEVCEYHEDTVRERRSTLLRSPDNDGELIVPFDNEPAGSATSTKKMCPNIPFAYIQAAATVVVGFGLFVIPFVPVDLMNTKAEQRLIGILLAVVTSWLFSLAPIPLTALMVGPLCVVYGVTTAEEAFRYYADPLLFLFYGAFFIAAAMSRHGLDSRLARRLTENQFVNDIPWRLRLCSMVCGAFMSMWISNTATTAILLPIIMGTFSNREHPRSDTISRAEAIMSPRSAFDLSQATRHQSRPPAHATGSILAVAYSCSVGGLGTLIGTPPNLIATRLLAAEGYKIDFVAWLQVGLPCTVGLVLLIFVIVCWMHPADGQDVDAADGVRRPVRGFSAMTRSTQRGADEPSSPMSCPLQSDFAPSDRTSDAHGESGWSRGELVTALSFSLAVTGWTLPPFLKLCNVDGHEELAAALPVSVVAMLASSILFVVPDGTHQHNPVLPWSEGQKIDWGLIMLFGGGISLGMAMKTTGLALTLGRGFVKATGVTGLWTVTGVFTVFTCFFTEICSNTASTNILIPLVIGICSELNISPVPPCVGVALAASCAFMMPIATGPNAIAFKTALVPLPVMVKTGLVVNVAASIYLLALLRGLMPAYGWDELATNTTREIFD